MHPRVGEQRDVPGVVGVVVAQHHVGHVVGRDAERGERLEDQRGGADHAGVDHDERGTVPYEDHARGDALVVGVAVVQDGELSNHGRDSTG